MADTPKAQGRQFGFHGREKEFAWLRGMFDAVATKDSDGKYTGPRMAVIVAESGIGKSRLVQELYIRLTNDPKWDPPEFDYWPEAFGDGGVNLRAVPDMRGHVPKGPPRFAWLGARWQSPEERNALERRSVLPELRSSVVVHAEILKSHGSAWAHAASRVRESVRKEGVGESIGAAADLVGIPFFGLMSKLAKGVKDLAADRLAGPKSFEKVEQEEVRSEVDEVLDCMRLLLNGSGAVPTVLWLDDAQWIDAETQAFLHKLWKEAERRKWPLLIAVTHWEREWRHLAIAEREGEAGDTLYDFVGKDGVEVQVIDCAETAALRAHLTERLPGLAPQQQALLVGKAGGNFLTMVENIGELLRQPANFVDRDIRAALSPAGERKVERWESLREKRVEQRFGELEPEVQDLLGWSSHLGQRFLRDVVVEFASEAAKVREAPALIERCVDPYVILGRPGENTREFRDKAFHAVATRHFENYGDEHREALSAVLRRHLAEWVNNSFDAEGNEIWPDEEEGIVAPERSATSLSQEERRDLLGIAMRELPLPEQPDWSNPEHVVALRAVHLSIITDAQEGLWDRVRALCRPLATISFWAAPDKALSVSALGRLSGSANTAGAWELAERVETVRLRALRNRSSESETVDGLRTISQSLKRLGEIHQNRGRLVDAVKYVEEAIDIRNRLIVGSGCFDDLHELTQLQVLLSRFLAESGDRRGARKCATESVANARRLTALAETYDSLAALSMALYERGSVLSHDDASEGALCHLKESLAIQRRLVDFTATPGSRWGLAAVLIALAVVEESLNPSGALARYKEAHDLVEDTDHFDERPKHTHGRGAALAHLARVHMKLGDLESARDCVGRGVDVSQKLLDDDVGFEALELFADLQETLMKINLACGDAFGALEASEGILAARFKASKDRGSTPRGNRRFLESLSSCRDLAIRLGYFQRGCELAMLRVFFAGEVLGPDRSPRALEHLLTHACPLIRAVLELGDACERGELARPRDDFASLMLVDLGGSPVTIEVLKKAAVTKATDVEDWVDALVAAFDDPLIDREEQQLDSTTLLRCAEGIDLVARLRAAQGDAKAEKEARTRAIELRARAEALKVEEDAGASAADEESDEDNPHP